MFILLLILIFLAAAGGERVRFETFPEAGHGLNYIVDTERYHRCVEEFIAACEKIQ